MPSRADVLRFAQANRDIRALVTRDMRSLWARLDVADALAVKASLEAVLPDLVAAYGELAVTVAADFFDEMRENARVVGRHGAVLAPVVDVAEVRTGARWAITPLFGGDGPTAALGRLTQVVDRLALQPGRDTIDLSVRRDPADARWARVPVGKTCAFCTMLASRGAEYGSARAAGDGNRFHADCDCTPTPVWSAGDLPEGYDPDALYADYRAAADAAGSGRTSAVLSALREQQHSH